MRSSFIVILSFFASIVSTSGIAVELKKCAKISAIELDRTAPGSLNVSHAAHIFWVDGKRFYLQQSHSNEATRNFNQIFALAQTALLSGMNFCVEYIGDDGFDFRKCASPSLAGYCKFRIQN